MLTFKKIKVKSTSVALEYDKKDGDFTEHWNLEGARPPHEDMVAVMQRLVPHLMLIAGQVDGASLDETAEMMQASDYTVTGVSWGGQDESRGVVLVGQRKLPGKRVLNLVTPFTKFEPSEFEEGYEYAGPLFHATEALCDEAEQYLNGKHAPDSQLNLFDEPKKELTEAEKAYKKTLGKMKDKGYTVSALVGDVEIGII